jgi:hypothetical protein
MNLFDVGDVHIGNKSRYIGTRLVIMRELEEIEHSVRRVIECEDVECNVHMPVIVDPFRQNRLFVQIEWGWDSVRIHGIK